MRQGKKALFLLLISGACLTAVATVNDELPAPISSGVPGYLTRGSEFAVDGNPQAVEDQIRLLNLSDMSLTPDERRTADFLAVKGAFETGAHDAMTLAEEFLERYPASSEFYEVLMMKADLCFFHKDFGDALTIYERIPVSAFAGEMRRQLLYRKAYSMVKTGYYDSALAIFRELRSDGRYGEAALFYEAYIDYVKGDYDSAYRKFSDVKRTSEKGLEAEHYKNQIDFKRGDYRKVADAGRRLLTSDLAPEIAPETMKVTGLSYFKLGEKESARKYLENYLDAAGSGADASALYALGTIYYDEGKREKAKSLFSQLTDDRTDIAQSAWLYLGQIYIDEDNGGAASIAFDKAARMTWDHGVAETAFYNLSVASAEGKNLPFTDAAGVMEEFMTSYPDSPYVPAVSRYLTSAYYNQRDYESALRAIERIKNPDAEVKGEKQKILYELGKSRLIDGDADGAVAALAEAVKYPYNASITAQSQLWLGDAWYAKKNYREASKWYSQAISSGNLGDNLALAEYNLGYASLKLKEYQKGKLAFGRALAEKGLTSAQKTDARLRLADCLYYTGDYTKALEEFRALQPGAGSEAVYASMREADIMGRQGKTAEQIGILKRLADGGAGVWTKEVLTRLGEAYSVGGNDKAASEIYGRLLSSGLTESENSRMMYALAANADKLYENGDEAAAYKAYLTMEKSDIPEIHSAALVGLMRTADDVEEAARYAEKVMQLPGVSPVVTDEARFIYADGLLDADSAADRERGVAMMKSLAASQDSEWSAQSAVRLGEYYLEEDEPAMAEKILLDFIDRGTDEQYWLARGYIALSDAYVALGNEYLAKLYVESLRDNYPGNEADIRAMIRERLK